MKLTYFRLFLLGQYSEYWSSAFILTAYFPNITTWTMNVLSTCNVKVSVMKSWNKEHLHIFQTRLDIIYCNTALPCSKSTQQSHVWCFIKLFFSILRLTMRHKDSAPGGGESDATQKLVRARRRTALRINTTACTDVAQHAVDHEERLHRSSLEERVERCVSPHWRRLGHS